MTVNWKDYVGKTLNVTMYENYGVSMDAKSTTPVYEIVFKTGKLEEAYDDGIMLEAERENVRVLIFIPHTSIKCVEIFEF